jgi:hypothetical protein
MKLPHRRQFLHLAAGAAALPAVSRFAWAQAYPTRPVSAPLDGSSMPLPPNLARRAAAPARGRLERGALAVKNRTEECRAMSRLAQ